MPANPKYLTKSPWQRFAKISAAILGGYMVSVALHLVLASWFDRINVVISSTYSSFILWAVLMVLAFLAKNGWRIWGIYLLATFLLGIIIYFGNNTDLAMQ